MRDAGYEKFRTRDEIFLVTVVAGEHFCQPTFHRGGEGQNVCGQFVFETLVTIVAA